MLIAAGQVTLGSIDIPLGAQVLLNAVNGLFHHPLHARAEDYQEPVTQPPMMRQSQMSNISALAAPSGRRF